MYEIKCGILLYLVLGDNIELKQPKKSRASFSELLEVLKERNTKESELKTEQLRLEREKFKLDKRGIGQEWNMRLPRWS